MAYKKSLTRIKPDDTTATVKVDERPDAAKKQNVQHVNHATIVNQYGSNCMSIAHVDVLSL